MEVEARCVGNGQHQHHHHHSGRARRMLGSSPTTSVSGGTPAMGSASSPLLQTMPNSLPSSPSQATISIFTPGDHSSRTVTPNSPYTSSTAPSNFPNNASPRVQGLSRALSVTAAASSSPRVASGSTVTSPSIAARNPRRLSAPTTPLLRQSPSHRGQQRPALSPSGSNSPARRNHNRMSSPLAHPQPPRRETMVSPPRRPRVESSVKLLPPLYQHCDTADLVVLISDMLGELVVLNDQIPLSTGGLTRFHSRAPPTISIPDYLHRLTLHSSLQPSILLSMVYYIDILSTLYPTFTISSLTVHRFLITAATVASKGLCDSFLTNSFYARVGGVSLMELNLLELEFLTRVGWRIVPRGEVLGEYYRSLVGRMSARYGIDEKAQGGKEFVGEIAGQRMAGEIIPQHLVQPRSQTPSQSTGGSSNLAVSTQEQRVQAGNGNEAAIDIPGDQARGGEC